MKNLRELKGVTVLGLGETGLQAALFLKRKGYDVFVSDCQRSEAHEKRSALLSEAQIPFELGGHTVEKIGAADWTVISPGIPPSSEIYQWLSRKRIPIVSEVEVASWFSPGEVIAVTGTSGKTTVTTLLARVFQAQGFESVACGNIGNPWIGELDRLTPQAKVILEVSSFQLLHTFSLHPRIGILLNIGLNHLDWHPHMKDYVAAKLSLFQNQTPEDYAFVRARDRQAFFPRYPFLAKVFSWGDREGEDSNKELLYEIARLEGLDLDKTGEVLSQFEGLEHRLERVAEIDGIQFVNDSKCTTLEALLWALDKFPDQRVILLAGGHAKGADFDSIRGRLARKVKQAVIYGEAQELLWKSWQGAIPLIRSTALNDAFEAASKIAKPGDTVLLSPACASFDQFSNYQERGRLFKDLTRRLCLEKQSSSL